MPYIRLDIHGYVCMCNYTYFSECAISGMYAYRRDQHVYRVYMEY
jgi:hypothetical protein